MWGTRFGPSDNLIHGFDTGELRIVKRDAKPKPPYVGFPLTLRRDGRYCKKINGQVYYFGRWPDWQEAIAEYEKQRDALHAGRPPRPVGGLTLGQAIEHFLSFKQSCVQAGRLGQRSVLDYKRTCDLLTLGVPANSPLMALEAEDFQRMAREIEKGTPKKPPKKPTAKTDIIKRRAQGKHPKLQTGKRRRANPTTQKGHLNRATIFFKYVTDNGLCEKPLRYQQALAPPSRLQFARLDLARGSRDFTAEEIQATANAADPALRAMILLGLSCAFSNADCGTLRRSEIDLQGGWHHKARYKTGTERHAPLWPEVVDAIREPDKTRPPSKQDFVFMRRDGSLWVDETEAYNFISDAFRDVLKGLGLYKKHTTGFYALRRTFATIAANAGIQPAVNHIMGHRDSTMPAVYRQRVYQEKLIEVSQYVRRWYLGQEKLQRHDRDGFSAIEWK